MVTYARENLKLAGSAPDLIPAEVQGGVWNDTNNVAFVDGETFRFVGQEAVMGTPLFTPRALAFYTDPAGQPFWLYAGEDGIGVTDGATHWDVTPPSWTPPALGSFMAFAWNGYVIIHTSGEDPVFWGGVPTVDCAPLPNWPTGWRFIAMRPHKNFLFAIGQLDSAGQQRVAWSDAAEAGTLPGSWIAAADNFAGFVDLGDTGTPAIEGVTLRDSFVVLKGESIHSFTLGGPDVFTVQQIFAGVGIVGVNAWTQGPQDQILFLSSTGDLVLTDGSSWQSVLAGKAQRALYQELGTELFYNCCAATLDRVNLSKVCYPVGGDTACTRSINFEWNSGHVSFGDMANVLCMAGGRLLTDVGLLNSWDGDSEEWRDDGTPWNFAISGASNDDIILGKATKLLAFKGSTLDGVPFAAYAFKEGQDFGDAQQRKLLVRAWPRITGTEGDVVSFRFGGQETADGNVTWAPLQNYVIGVTTKLDFFVQGRFVAIEMTSNEGDAWRLGSIDLEFRDAGAW